jgi:Mechanosensitive ion channel, beta-domain
MSDAFGSLGFDLLILLVLGAALWFVAGAAHWAIGVVPMNKERRTALARISPIAGAALALCYLLFAARTLFRREPSALPLVLALVVAGFSAAAWPAIRDFLAGVVLKAGRVCDEGDHVRIGNLEGRVAKMGHRVLVIETRDGDEAILPYSQIAREAVVRTRSLGGVMPHKFRIGGLPSERFAELREQIKREALLCHWSAFARDPEVVPVGGGGVEVTVFSLDDAHGPDIEAAVRRGLEPPARTQVPRLGTTPRSSPDSDGGGEEPRESAAVRGRAR